MSAIGAKVLPLSFLVFRAPRRNPVGDPLLSFLYLFLAVRVDEDDWYSTHNADFDLPWEDVMTEVREESAAARFFLVT